MQSLFTVPAFKLLHITEWPLVPFVGCCHSECTCNPAPLSNTAFTQISGLVRYVVGAPVRTLKNIQKTGYGEEAGELDDANARPVPQDLCLSHLTQRFLTFNFSHTTWQVEEEKNRKETWSWITAIGGRARERDQKVYINFYREVFS